MVQAIGSSARPTSSGAGVSAAGISAQLARYQKTLSECVNCETAKTPEGKRNIQELSDKISVLKTRLQETTDANHKQPATAAQSDPGNGAPSSTRGPAVGGLGTTVNLYA